MGLYRAPGTTLPQFGMVAPPVGFPTNRPDLSPMATWPQYNPSPPPSPPLPEPVAENMCDMSCDAAKQRVRDAKVYPKACQLGDSRSTLFYKYLQWRELCAARRHRDRICPTLEEIPGGATRAGEAGRQIKDCAQATNCSKLLHSSNAGTPNDF